MGFPIVQHFFQLTTETLFAQKLELEQCRERKRWVWEETQEEHSALEKIDAELIASGYYDRAIRLDKNAI